MASTKIMTQGQIILPPEYKEKLKRFIFIVLFRTVAAVLADRTFSRQPKNEKFSRQFK